MVCLANAHMPSAGHIFRVRHFLFRVAPTLRHTNHTSHIICVHLDSGTVNIGLVMNLLFGRLSSSRFFAFAERNFDEVLNGRFLALYSSNVHINRAGLPATTLLDGTDFVTTDSPATSTLSPMVTPGMIEALGPIYT